MARRATDCADAILKDSKNALYRKIMSVEHVHHNILIAADTLSEKTNKLIDDHMLKFM